MAQTIRVSLPTYNALTDTDIRHYSLYADSDNILIKEHSRGSGDVAGAPSVTHSLGYIPYYIVMGKVGSGTYKIANAWEFSGAWAVKATNTTLIFDDYASSYDDYQYYIFYDNFS